MAGYYKRCCAGKYSCLFTGGKNWEPPDYPWFIQTVFSVFYSWELQQISYMDHFLGQLLATMSRYQMKKREDANSEYSPVRSQFWMDEYPRSLEKFALKLKRLVAMDSSLFDCLGQERELCSGRVTGSSNHFYMFARSHRFTTPPPPPETQNNNQDSADDIDDDFRQEPWAWNDALQGHKTSRWGCDLVKEPSPESSNQQKLAYEDAQNALESWRWFGMVFWDRERAEELKRSSALKSCQCGWLPEIKLIIQL